ncbi:hypothetical protein CLV49_0698 [Labedella gwakjiensis]|uniref:Uncharacterized protein n=1 Tax=Labedella gwakjiensis TaxID=390269 RepID=A0A2P8GT19_9MICO|nr:hypothetical protein [Labedella gwakjiensis]PSL37092.1 hypothetical protein CLV49_0698 [Labedella gwakjiensis]RUQ82005.1 hypothetical protein ELQ93_17105 [Labedella gwakjiensis]
MAEPRDDESGITILRDAGGAIAFGIGLLLIAGGLLLAVLGLSGASTIVGQGVTPVVLGPLTALVGIVVGAWGLVALYRRLTSR